jgi:hypothetical protein
MQYRETSNSTGIVDMIYWHTGADTTSYPLGIVASHVNTGLGEIIANILKVDKRWKWDDSNITKSLETTFSLVNGTGEYGILASTPAQNYQDFNRLFGVSVKDANGEWRVLEYIDREMTAKMGIDWEEFEDTNGTPAYYMPEGTQLFLKPAPNYDSASGAKLFVQRNPVYFVYSDTTKVPPFDSKYHYLLALYGERGWALKNDPGKVALIESLIKQGLKELRIDYASRLQISEPEYININWK